MNPQAPIGIFDSGMGGLTVARALSQLLSKEQLVYFGDTMHLPYGEKTPSTIRHYSLGITRFLEELGCKAIVIACNTASAVAFEAVKAEAKVPVFNVLDPVINHVAQLPVHKVGVIGTRATIRANVYANGIAQANPQQELASMATPLLVPIIEEGFAKTDISRAIIQAYLSDSRFQGAEALILGCTHYPILQKEFEAFFGDKVTIVDSPRIVAEDVARRLSDLGLLATKRGGENHFYTSELSDSFHTLAQRFFGHDVQLQERNIWHPA
jgi:glutamate racemase